jgi:predicted signal transduction protein with EAL and GGDEF domain
MPRQGIRGWRARSRRNPAGAAARVRSEGSRFQLQVAHRRDVGRSEQRRHLRRFPIDAIKIDKSFTAEIATSDGTASIIRAIVAMASSLGVETVAEGVENDVQLRFLALLDCGRVQGFHIGRPMPAAQVTPLLGPPDVTPVCDLELEATPL